MRPSSRVVSFVLAGCLVACGDDKPKGTPEATASVLASSATAKTAKPATPKSAPLARAGDPDYIGVAECDEQIRLMKGCAEPDNPDHSMKLSATIRAYKSMAQESTEVEDLKEGCKAAADQILKSGCQ